MANLPFINSVHIPISLCCIKTTTQHGIKNMLAFVLLIKVVII